MCAWAWAWAWACAWACVCAWAWALGASRQRLTTDKTTLEDLARQLLPREYVEELVPVARAFNRIDPKNPVRP